MLYRTFSHGKFDDDIWRDPLKRKCQIGLGGFRVAVSRSRNRRKIDIHS